MTLSSLLPAELRYMETTPEELAMVDEDDRITHTATYDSCPLRHDPHEHVIYHGQEFCDGHRVHWDDMLIESPPVSKSQVPSRAGIRLARVADCATVALLLLWVLLGFAFSGKLLWAGFGLLGLHESWSVLLSATVLCVARLIWLARSATIPEKDVDG